MAQVAALAKDAGHRFSKLRVDAVFLRQGHGIDGDAHAGAKVRHRSRVAVDPDQPNLRQVHLISSELFEELALSGFAIAPGDLGENITTQGIDLLALPRGTRLKLGKTAVVEVTGLRNPCAQIEAYRKGLLGLVVRRDETGNIQRRAGVMGIVLCSGPVMIGDPIEAEFPPPPFVRLDRV